MSIKEQLIAEIQRIINPLGGNFTPIVESPSDLSHGDFSTNTAMVLAKALKKNPMEVGEIIKSKINNEEFKFFDKIEIIKPGFINFWLSKEYLEEYLSLLISNKEQFNKEANSFTNKKFVVEFTDPNPFKEFHIGHLYSNIVGEAISRLLESQGAKVLRVCYQGDVGLHVAKAIWGIMQLKDDMPDDSTPLSSSPSKRAAFLGQAYALGAKEYEADQKAKEEIIELNKKIYAKDASIIEVYEKGKRWSLDYFEQMYSRLGAFFNKLYFESEVADYGISCVKENIGKVFKKSEGAVIFPGEEYGLHTRVFINSQNLPTYEAKELGLAVKKFEDYKFDQSINITGNEIKEYFKVLLKVLSLLNPALAEKTKHISHGMVRLPTGKMSSRTGDVVTAESLLDEAYEKAWNKIQEVTKTKIEGEYAYHSAGGKVLPSEQNPTAEQVGVGAVKYALLKSNIGSDIIFNFDESISFEGNAGPYLQYAYVRTQSVFDKAEKDGIKLEENFIKKIINPKIEKEEADILRLLFRFNDVIKSSAEKFSPNILCNYLFLLAQSFNLFYQKHPILKEGDKREFRLALTKATGRVLKSGLNLLGIAAPEKM